MRPAACLGLVLASCNAIFGIEPGEPLLGGGGDGGVGAQAGTGPGGGGSAAGGEGAGAVCTDGDPCYTGDPATLVEGSNCRQGTWQSCDAAPSCVGEVLASSEDFAAAGDEDCDGLPRGDLRLGQQLDAEVGVACDVASDGGLLMAGSVYSVSDLDGAAPAELPFNDSTAFLAKFDSGGGYAWHYAFTEYPFTTLGLA